MGRHRRDYRQVQRSKIQAKKQLKEPPSGGGERIANIDKSGHGTKSRVHPGHSLASQFIQEKPHVRGNPLHTQKKTKDYEEQPSPPWKKQDGERSNTPQHTQEEWKDWTNLTTHFFFFKYLGMKPHGNGKKWGHRALTSKDTSVSFRFCGEYRQSIKSVVAIEMREESGCECNCAVSVCDMDEEPAQVWHDSDMLFCTQRASLLPSRF